VCEHDPYDPSDAGRKHTALGRFRHENASYRKVAGKRFVLYMGDDKNNEAVYKFVSDRAYREGRRSNNRRILASGTLYVARWEPEGRRRFAAAGDTVPLTPTEGTGSSMRVEPSELDDTATKLRARFGAEYDLHFATNRPEDVEVAPDGSVYVALTNNTTVNDSHGSVRSSWRTATTPRPWASPGRTSRPEVLPRPRLPAARAWLFEPRQPRLRLRGRPVGGHRHLAFRFANMPAEAEGTGPYFTPDERTLFLNVQHPGEDKRTVPRRAWRTPPPTRAGGRGATGPRDEGRPSRCPPRWSSRASRKASAGGRRPPGVAAGGREG
jgi:secreted PhoX family phosphatase